MKGSEMNYAVVVVVVVVGLFSSYLSLQSAVQKFAGATVQIKCGVSFKEGYSKEKFESSKRRTTLKMLINFKIYSFKAEVRIFCSEQLRH